MRDDSRVRLYAVVCLQNNALDGTRAGQRRNDKIDKDNEQIRALVFVQANRQANERMQRAHTYTHMNAFRVRVRRIDVDSLPNKIATCENPIAYGFRVPNVNRTISFCKST